MPIQERARATPHTECRATHSKGLCCRRLRGYVLAKCLMVRCRFEELLIDLDDGVGRQPARRLGWFRYKQEQMLSLASFISKSRCSRKACECSHANNMPPNTYRHESNLLHMHASVKTLPRLHSPTGAERRREKEGGRNRKGCWGWGLGPGVNKVK